MSDGQLPPFAYARDWLVPKVEITGDPGGYRFSLNQLPAKLQDALPGCVPAEHLRRDKAKSELFEPGRVRLQGTATNSPLSAISSYLSFGPEPYSFE